MNKFFHKYTTLNSLFYYICIRNRDVAQLVARHVRDVEAAGSSPVISTERGRTDYQCVFVFDITRTFRFFR